MTNESQIRVGLKTGSLNTCIAIRTPDGGIYKDCKKTAIWYPKTLLQKQSSEPPTVGDDALLHADAHRPLNFGLVETDDGIQQIKDILLTFKIPQNSNMVLASPAAEIKDGTRRLVRAIDETCNPKSILQFSEGVCSAVYILKDVEKLKTSTMLVANLGSSTFEFACVHEARTLLLTAHSEASGNIVDERIRMRIQNSIGDAMITTQDVRVIKEAASLNTQKMFKVRGQTREGIVERPISDEVTKPLEDYIDSVCTIIKQEMRTINPEIRKIALENPLIVAGGMANIEGLPERISDILSRKLNYPVKILYSTDNDGHIAPAIGALLLAEAIAEEEE